MEESLAVRLKQSVNGVLDKYDLMHSEESVVRLIESWWHQQGVAR